MCKRRVGGERERDTKQDRLKNEVEVEILIKSVSHILVGFYPFIQHCPWG